MKKLAAALALGTALLSGCVAYPVDGPRQDYGYRDSGYRNNGYGYRDRDRDGVPNRYDTRPRDPRYY
jgi:hypothetical protein